MVSIKKADEKDISDLSAKFFKFLKDKFLFNSRLCLWTDVVQRHGATLALKSL